MQYQYKNYYSDYIYLAESVLRCMGIKSVILWETKLPKNIVGRISYAAKEIKISSNNSAKQALFVLAHEAGHWISYLTHGKVLDKFFSPKRREWMAYYYGWKFIEIIGADRVISKQDWKDDHIENNKFIWHKDYYSKQNSKWKGWKRKDIKKNEVELKNLNLSRQTKAILRKLKNAI